MNRILPLIIVALALLAFATLFLVAGPAAQIRTIEPPEGLEPYSEAEQRGREVYVSMGCVYCHTQQPRSSEQAPDATRGWGRASTAADYVYDEPHLLGTMRTGPDLLNVGARLPSRQWHLTHLYQPRAVTPTSIMPSFPFLLEAKEKAGSDDVVVKLPEQYRPEGKVIVAKQAALDLTDYLLSLDRTYPVEHDHLRDNGFRAEKEDS
ncbi:cbb3-type cytochrome c oxidase subunit II [Halomonas piscis]|uniref:cbb3-type cytochrome c oxidase subunit II n=1 Tax=Halomonas piscis TaxID=3031727 RepID=UPI00289E3525|nr:cbb3-type cytochrome c oxidase subunit II [Halomonas piscis]